MLALSQQQHFACGKKRLVFAHPDDPTLVIKVMRPDYAASRRKVPLWGAARKDYYCIHMVLRELREHIEARLAADRLPDFLPPVEGLADTDLGPGLIVSAVRGRDGDFAPTLAQLIETGRVDTRLIADLERFCEQVEASSLVIGDLNPHNVLYGYSRARGSHFMLVDGLGDKTLVPLLKMSRVLSRRSRARKTRRLIDAVRARDAAPRVAVAIPART